MVSPDATNFISDAISGYGSKKYRNGHLCVSGLKLLATTVNIMFGMITSNNAGISKIHAKKQET